MTPYIKLPPDPAVGPVCKPPSYTPLVNKLEHAIHARAHAFGNTYMASEHEQADLQSILDDVYLEWSTHAWNEL
eukprot:6546264-Pyramimonas_sp.AAC.1